LRNLAVVAFYNQRGTAEQWIKEGKNAIHWTRLSCRRFDHNAVRLQFHALACNLGNFMRTLALPDAVGQWSLTTLRENLVKIGAKVVRHGRSVIFQMAEVAIPRDLFADILRRHRPAQADAGPGMTDGKPLLNADHRISAPRSWTKGPFPAVAALHRRSFDPVGSQLLAGRRLACASSRSESSSTGWKASTWEIPDKVRPRTINAPRRSASSRNPCLREAIQAAGYRIQHGRTPACFS